MKGGDFVAVGEPLAMDERTEAVQGWSFPLKGWPQATFRLDVTVEDLVTGNVAVGQTIFTVEGAAAAL